MHKTCNLKYAVTFLFAVLFIIPVHSAHAEDYITQVKGVFKGLGGKALKTSIMFNTDNGGKYCSEGEISTSDAAGDFSLKFITHKTWWEHIDVLVRSYSLCIKKEEKWVEVWSLRTGPPPENINFNCMLKPSNKNICNALVDGHEVNSKN